MFNYPICLSPAGLLYFCNDFFLGIPQDGRSDSLSRCRSGRLPPERNGSPGSRDVEALTQRQLFIKVIF